jgi:hypothetical protein
MADAAKTPSDRKHASRTVDGRIRQLFLRRAVRRTIARARARPGAVARSAPPAVAIAIPLAVAVAFTLTEAGAFGARPAIRAHAAILFQTRRLSGGAFFLGLWRPAVALPISRTVAGKGGHCHPTEQQTRCNQTTDHRALHN